MVLPFYCSFAFSSLAVAVAKSRNVWVYQAILQSSDNKRIAVNARETW